MYRFLLIGWLLGLYACNEPSSEKINNKEPETGEGDSLRAIHTMDPVPDTTETDTPDMSTYYIVITDTGTNYYSLRDKMIGLSRRSGLPIDTMGRSYLKDKNRIALPLNHDDDLYAGEYVPRRFPSENLSLEYLNTYQPSSDKNTIALVAGIHETAGSADSLCRVLRQEEKNVFRLKAQVYTGCMH